MESRRKAFFIFCIVSQISAVQSCKEDPIGILNDLALRSPETISDYWDDGEGTVLNDDQLTDGWYRAVHNGWQYMLVDNNAIPDFVTCSTYWPIYLNGNHTPVDQLSGNPISAEVCIRDVLQSCITTYEIQIRKCDGEIQYKLKGTLWFSAYCFYKGFQLPKNGTLAPAPENVNFGKVVVMPELDFKEVPDKGLIVNIPFIKFRCEFEEQEGLFYNVAWYVDKKKFGETMGPSRNLDSLKLQEDNLLARNISLGKQIQCGVSASSTVNGLQTDVTFSVLYYAGIKVLNTTILLDKQSSATVQMVSSVPIGCRYVKLPNGKILKNACKTTMQLFVDNNDLLQCEKGSVLNKIRKEDAFDNQMCSKYLPTLTEADTWNPDTLFNFSIVTSDHNYDDTSKFILKLQFPKTIGHAIWKNYLFPDITVLVQNKDLYKDKICKSRTDPHMKTFDRYYYGQQNEGTFIMYQHQQNGIEIQQKTKQCADRVGTCICGIAVSAGQDIFMINRCSTAVFFGFTQCGDGGILQVVKRSDIRYRVLTPIGTRIEIHLRLKWINVDIYAAPKDMGNVLGLCGKIDGDRKNDLQHRRSTRTSPLYGGNHYDFIRSWKIDDDSEDNLFSQNFKTREKWMQRNGLYCVCQKNDIALCSPSQFLNCTMKDSITKTKCHIEGRRKRSTGYQSDKEIRRLLSLMTERGHRVKVVCCFIQDS